MGILKKKPKRQGKCAQEVITQQGRALNAILTKQKNSGIPQCFLRFLVPTSPRWASTQGLPMPLLSFLVPPVHHKFPHLQRRGGASQMGDRYQRGLMPRGVERVKTRPKSPKMAQRGYNQMSRKTTQNGQKGPNCPQNNHKSPERWQKKERIPQNNQKGLPNNSPNYLMWTQYTKHDTRE